MCLELWTTQKISVRREIKRNTPCRYRNLDQFSRELTVGHFQQVDKLVIPTHKFQKRDINAGHEVWVSTNKEIDMLITGLLRKVRIPDDSARDSLPFL